MRYIIYGAGAIGGSIGARLHQGGHDVVLICRGEHLRKVQRDGLNFVTPAESTTLPIPAVSSPTEIQLSDEDVFFLTMKSQDAAAALNDLRAAAGDVPVVCVQNGVENERTALRMFTRVYGMLVFLPATLLHPGEVLMHASSVGGVLDAGRYPEGVDPLIEQVTADLTGSGFSARPDPGIMRLKYGKLLLNLANAVQALFGADAKAGDVVRGVRDEAVACFEAAGIEFVPPAEIGKRAAVITRGEIEGHPQKPSSTWQSLARRSRSVETDFLNGEIAMLGALHGVPTPYNRALQRAAAEAARNARPPGSLSTDELPL
jgi:2-dehydropantoate 2-reductase